MPRPINMADPEFEPTDEELQQLSREAFAHIPLQRAELAAKMRTRIAELREQSLERLREQHPEMFFPKRP